MTSQTDEDRWAQAQSLLERRPTEAAEQRLTRWRRNRLLFLSGFTVAGLALGLVVVLLVGGDVGGDDVDPPSWQLVTGLVISGAGCVLALTALVAVLKANRRLRVWGNPLAPLTRRQRKQLVAQVRGRSAAEPDRLPLARHMAELLVHQQLVWVTQLSMLVLWAGNWIADPTWWRLAPVVGFGALALTGGYFVRRDVTRARRFLETHPAPEGDAAVA
jgi:MFS family permease